MFYPMESLRKGGRLYLCWVADSWPLRFATITHRQISSQDIPAICDYLFEVINSESGRPSKRFSLRLTSQILRGLIRFYQKKMNIFICDLCMFAAMIMKMSHKKYAPITLGPATRRPPTSELPRIQIEEIGDEDVERQLLNPNVVARVEDITLREPTLPEHRRVDDGFGELHPDQAITALTDRSMEYMLAQETSAAQQSALELPHDFDKSHDRSRLAPHDTAQMERISEHDISVFRKSAEAPTLRDFEKEISEIPPPDVTAPELENQLAEKDTEMPEDGLNKDQTALEKDMNQDFILEELEYEPQSKRRKLKNKLIIDKRKQLNADFLRARIGNNNLELRCENTKKNKVINIVAPSYVLLNRAAHCGVWSHTSFGITLGYMFKRAQTHLERRKTPARDVEYTLHPRTTHTEPLLETIAQESMAGRSKTIPEQEIRERSVQDVSRNLDGSGLCLEAERSMVIPPGDVLDIADLPTQKIPMTSPILKRASQFEEPAKKRRQDKVCRRRSAEELNKENIPEENVLPTKRADVICKQSITERMTALLLAEKLANNQGVQKSIEPMTVAEKGHRKNSSDTSETPLGSLDRTIVSLGESENTTDSKRNLSDEWGTEGTLLKIFRCIRSCVTPITVDALLDMGPVRAGHKRFAAAYCFSSILKLKQNGFIKVITDDDTKAIKDMTLGKVLQ